MSITALILLYLLPFCLFAIISSGTGPAGEETSLFAKAKQLARDLLIIDSHLDTPIRMSNPSVDITTETSLHFDYPKAQKGGLNAPFMVIYIAPKYQEGGARKEANRLIDAVFAVAKAAPEKFAIARSPADILQHQQNAIISFPLGMENGAPLAGDLESLRYFYDRGIRYITLTHAKDNHICDSSYDSSRTWSGLSPFGKELIPAMNRLGMMIDISHVSDDTFYQVLDLSEAPVIASHSSCRYFLPGLERNMSDDMIHLLAAKGGVIQINFGAYFISQKYRLQLDQRQNTLRAYMAEQHLEEDDSEAIQFLEDYNTQHPIDNADLSDVADHIDHVVQLVGAEYVGIGSDFDGVPSVPRGLENVSKYPNLISELLRRGYDDHAIAGICGENFLRVWEEVNSIALRLQN